MSEQLNIPIYRAREIDSSEFIEGDLGSIYNSQGQIIGKSIRYFHKGFEAVLVKEIDPSTLAIHFPDMIDSENTKIFDSLSEDGKGGDKIEYQDRHFISCFIDATWTMILPKGSDSKMCYNSTFFTVREMKATGIQE